MFVIHQEVDVEGALIDLAEVEDFLVEIEQTFIFKVQRVNCVH